MPPTTSLARTMGFSAAVLMVLGLLTGGALSAAMTGKIPADARMMLSSHLNALLGCFFIICVAWSLPLLGYSEKGLRRLAWLIIVPNYANWLITAWKSFWKVSGVDAIGEVKNDTIFGMLTVFVVTPSLIGAVAWAYGFKRGAQAAAAKPQ